MPFPARASEIGVSVRPSAISTFVTPGRTILQIDFIFRIMRLLIWSSQRVTWCGATWSTTVEGSSGSSSNPGASISWITQLGRSAWARRVTMSSFSELMATLRSSMTGTVMTGT